MVATARAHLLARVQDRALLVIQDTTSLRDDGNKHGLYLHAAIAVDASDGALLGLVAADLLVHDATPKAHCNNRRLDEKESRRWVDATSQTQDLLAAGARSVTVIADREADLYEMFACRPEGVDVLVRSRHNRLLTDGTMLGPCCDGLAAWGQSRVELPAGQRGPARVASIELRASPIALKRPKRNLARHAAALPEQVELNVIDAREINPPPGTKALHWRLLTTHAVASMADVQRIIELYRRRWLIEQMFRVMKTRGFDIEAVGFDEHAPLKNLGCATLIAAVHTQQMLHARDGQAGRPMADVFDPADHPIIETIGRTLEGRTTRQKNPHPSGSLAHATWICARLGGWTGYYGKPAPIVLVRGHGKLLTMLDGVKRSGLV